MAEQDYYGFSDDMFNQQGFERLAQYKLKNGQHKMRILPPYAKDRLYFKVDLHWGYSDQNGNRYPVKCVGESICPICAEHKKTKARAEEMMANSGGDPQKVQAAKEMEKRASDIRRKPTYIYQILDFNGEHKQLALGYRAHESIYKKIMFFWKEKQVNITDPNKNMMIYIDRSGNGAQTHYQVEVLENTIKKIDVPKLCLLHEIHEDQEPEVLVEIVRTGFLPTNGKKEDKAQNNFNAGEQPPMGEQPGYMNDAPPPQDQNYQPQHEQNYHAPADTSQAPGQGQNQNGQGGIDFKSRTQNQVGTPSHSTTEGVAGGSQPSQGSPASSSPSNNHASSNSEANQNHQQPANETVGAFSADDVQF